MPDAMEDVLDRLKQREWHAKDGFVRDGIIDPTRWGSRPRVLFLFKEAHDKTVPRKDWDLRDFLRQAGTRYNMWRAAAAWAHVCHRLSKLTCLTYEQVTADRAELDEALFCSAIVNLKKSDGASRSEDEDLDLWVRRDSDLIFEQIHLIHPHLVICGSTWNRVKSVWLHSKGPGQWINMVDGIPFLDFWHPAVISKAVQKKHFNLLNEWLRSAYPKGFIEGGRG